MPAIGQQAITGLGDEAFSAAPSGQDMIVAWKGKTLVALLAMLDWIRNRPAWARRI